MYRLLKDAGVDATLSVKENEDHSFDYKPDAEGPFSWEEVV